MGVAYNDVMTILGRVVEDADPPDDAELTALWRGCVPDPVEEVRCPSSTRLTGAERTRRPRATAGQSQGR